MIFGWSVLISDVFVEGDREMINTYVDGSGEGKWGRGRERLEWVFVAHDGILRYYCLLYSSWTDG